MSLFFFFFFQAEDGIRDLTVTGVQTCALPIFLTGHHRPASERVRSRAKPSRRGGIRRHNRAIEAGDLQIILQRSEEHTSELQSQSNLVCRLLLEKKKK